MRPLYAILLAFSLAFTAGCTQGSMPSACAGLSADHLPSCIYESAVLEQNPYSCYSLQNGAPRAKCLNDASDSSMKALLERLTPQERAQLLGIAAAVESQPAGAGSAIPQGQETGTAPANPPKTASQPDAQAYEQAIAANDMAQCATIIDASVRASCITQVALQVKKPEVCNALSLKPDIDICNLYAKGGEQAK